jgi:hypothetical protein
MPKKEMSRERKRNRSRSGSIKKTWDKLVKKSDSRALLKKAWIQNDDILKEKIKKIYNKYKDNVD